MSFFKSKTIVVTVRDIRLTFNLISKKEMSELEYYGKITDKEVQEAPELIGLASDEITKLLAKKIVAKEGESVPTAEDLNDLTNDELIDIIHKVTGSSETVKKTLNHRR